MSEKNKCNESSYKLNRHHADKQHPPVPDWAVTVAGFLNAHRFTQQMRRELAEWIPEIACREDVSVDDIILDKAIQSILHDGKLNAPQKHKKIRDTLYKMRFPEYSKLQDNWKRIAAAANPAPSKIQFVPSPGFEKKRLEIKLTIENADEVQKLAKSLLAIDSDVWDKLLFPKN